MDKLQKGEVVLNRWEIEDYVGRGRYGMVYKAHDNTGNEAAVKIISLPTEEQIKDYETLIGGGDEAMEAFFDQMANRFVAEVESLRRLNSPNAIRYIDHSASKRGVNWDIIIVMEYAYTLNDYLESTTFTYQDVIQLGIGIANVLEKCEELKILHRDIKEDNIFVGKDGLFKIGDFGAANMASNGTHGMMTNGIGTPYYMAPEVETSGKYTSSVDIYSLGIVLYRLLNYKRFPFMPRSNEPISQDDNGRAFGERRSGKPCPPPEFCPEPLVPVILKACEYHPQNRFANASEFKAAFIAGVQALDSMDISQPVPMPAGRKKPPIVFTPPQPPVTPQPPVHTPPQPPVQPQPPISGGGMDAGNRTTPLNINNIPNQQGGGGYQPPRPPQPQNSEDGMKTVDVMNDLVRKFGKDSGFTKKINEMIAERDKERSNNKMLERDLKKKKRNTFVVIGIAGLLLVALVLSMLFGIDYRNNKKDGDQLYMYFLGIPVKNICPDEDITACYVVRDNKWIYFSWHNKPWDDPEDLQMYKIDKKGGNLTRISINRCEYLVEYEDYIYYINTTDIEKPTLCRVSKNAEDSKGEVLYNEYPVDCDYGLRLSDNLIEFKVWAEDDKAEYKYLDVKGQTLYNKKSK